MSSYDPFYHLCKTLFASNNNLFPMLTAYFDDSGDESIAVVAGYLATTEMWTLFNQRWVSLLQRYQVKQSHRADLENFQGEFVDWDPPRRTEFLKKAHTIIRCCTHTGIGVALIKKDFEEAIPQHDLLRKYGIFGWCAHGCLAGVNRWCKEKKLNEPIEYMFEAGTVGQSQLNTTLSTLYKHLPSREQNRIKGWSFYGKEILPLQAADVVAYEYFKFIRNELVDNRKRPIRRSARNLIRPHEAPFFRHFDKKSFEFFIQQWKLTDNPTP